MYIDLEPASSAGWPTNRPWRQVNIYVYMYIICIYVYVYRSRAGLKRWLANKPPVAPGKYICIYVYYMYICILYMYVCIDLDLDLLVGCGRNLGGWTEAPACQQAAHGARYIYIYVYIHIFTSMYIFIYMYVLI